MIVDISDPRIVEWIKEGKVFIYPTDTVYGLGCDATNAEAVQRIREIKGSSKPYSVIAPGKKWIRKHCDAGEELDKLPGPYTFLYASDAKVACAPEGKIGVRIPNHAFSDLVEKSGKPFVTTSVNKTGEQPIQSVDEVSDAMLALVDVVVDVGALRGKPSTIIDYTMTPPKVIRK